MTLLSPPSLTFPVIGSSADVRLELFLTDDSHPHTSILRIYINILQRESSQNE